MKQRVHPRSHSVSVHSVSHPYSATDSYENSTHCAQSDILEQGMGLTQESFFNMTYTSQGSLQSCFEITSLFLKNAAEAL